MTPSRLHQRWVVAVVFVAGMFMNIMDATIVNTALPAIARQFHTQTTSADWVVIGYLLSLAVWIPASGWIGDRIGTKVTYLAALTLFTACSILCGQSQSLGQLVVLRLMQGVGGGMLAPVGQAMLFRAFPPERRAQASTILLIPTVLAPATGPLIGGLLVDQLSWRWIFYVNVPIGVAAFLFGLLFLHEHREPAAGRFDAPGFLLTATGLALLLYAISEGPTFGWASPGILGTGIAGLAAIALLIRVEVRRRAPMLALRLLGERLFRTTNLVSLFGYAAFMGVLFIMPQFLQEARGATALSSGLTTFPEAVGVILSSQLVGRLYLRTGPRRLMAPGLIGVTAAMTLLTRVGLGTDAWLIRLLMFAVGVGMAYMILPLQAASFAQISSADTGRASAIFNTQRQVAGATGVAVLATVLKATLASPAGRQTPASPSALVPAFHLAFVTAAALALVGAIISLSIHDTDAGNTMRRKVARGTA